ncbi:MAG: hypothetical protein ACXACY_29195 [Candidatus Hodarchaeales archaeon]|jgi:hypothetical protein
MKTPLEPSKQSMPNYGAFDLNIMQDTIGSAVQKTGFDQSVFGEAQSRQDLRKRIEALENKVEKLEMLFIVFSVPINSLNNKKFEFKKPIDVSIEQRGRAEFIACLYDAELYGYGESIPEALEDLKEAVVDQFKYLKKQESEIQLGRLPQKQLEFLNSIIATNA